MNALKRLVTTIEATFSGLVAQVENHEAIVDSAIDEAVRTTARAKCHMTKVGADSQRLRGRLAELALAEQSWTERARGLAGKDKERALQCLMRRRSVRQEVQLLATQLEAQSNAERNLRGDIELLEVRVQDLKRKRNMLRTREARSLALSALDQGSVSSVGSIDALINRWEEQIAEREAAVEVSAPQADRFESDFVTEEQLKELRQELNDLGLGEGASSSK